MISGIIHMLRSGARWRDCPSAYGPYTTIYNRFNRWSRQGIWFAIFEALTGSTGITGTIAIDSSTIKAHRSAGGGKGGLTAKRSAARAVGVRTRSAALTDAKGRPRVLLLSPGNAHDVVMAPALVAAAGPISKLIADKAYDTNSLRALLSERAIEPVIPSIRRRKPLLPYDTRTCRERNLIERMFCRLKDFRRIATRYEQARPKLPRRRYACRRSHLVDQLNPDPSPAPKNSSGH